jgi:uncharacterized membrane protein required for colicin V production
MIPVYMYIVLMLLGVIGLYLGFIEFRGKSAAQILAGTAAILLLTSFIASAGVYLSENPPASSGDAVLLAPVWVYIPLLIGLSVGAYVLLERKLI